VIGRRLFPGKGDALGFRTWRRSSQYGYMGIPLLITAFAASAKLPRSSPRS